MRQKGSMQPNSTALQIIYLPGERSLLCLIENIDTGMGLPHDYFTAEIICLFPSPFPHFLPICTSPLLSNASLVYL